MKWHFLGLVFGLVIQSQVIASSEKVMSVPGTSGTTVKFVYVKSKNPIAHIIAIPGGNGYMGIREGIFGVDFGRYSRHGSFTINTRKRFRRNGFSMAIVDWPTSDTGVKPLRTQGFRESMEYGQNIMKIIAHMKQDSDVPIWLLGHSRGTTSAAAQAINLGKENVQGVVLSASIAAGPKIDTYVPDMALDKIQVPALVLSADNDLCDEYTPKEAARLIGERMVHSPNAKVLYIKGARHHNNPGLVCRTNSAHSYAGIENKVADIISEYIKSNLNVR